jgi:hypothetical protein
LSSETGAAPWLPSVVVHRTAPSIIAAEAFAIGAAGLAILVQALSGIPEAVTVLALAGIAFAASIPIFERRWMRRR